ncbi:MAG: hypothetical protein OEV94_03820 [Deltaproteobacteria bacterium]|nr:hypothetical protein [Deltaproteobacteria bacterium]
MSHSEVLTTRRSDWTQLSSELYYQGVEGSKFGIGSVSVEKSTFGSSLRSRMNRIFPHKEITEYIGRNFNAKTFENLFKSEEGLMPYGLPGVVQVMNDTLGLPRNTLVVRVQNPGSPVMKAVVLYGGERMEGQLEQRLARLTQVLQGKGEQSPQPESARSSAGATAAPAAPNPLKDNPEHFRKVLAQVNLRNLASYKPDQLSKLVDALEPDKDSLPLELKPRFKAVSDWVVRQSMKRRPNMV